MASGRPDWYGSMAMHGKYGDEYISVALNSLGHMIGQMMGTDGVNLTTLRTDADGRIISVIRDPTNNRYLAVDAAGRMVAVMTGFDDPAYRPIAVDASGIMKANLSAQDLAFLTVRPAYGSTILEEDNANIPDSIETELILIIGQGVIYDGMISSACGHDPDNYFVRIKVDGNLIMDYSITSLFSYSRSVLGKFPMTVSNYNNVTWNYQAMISSIITFEESLGIYIYQTTGLARATWWDFRYALTP